MVSSFLRALAETVGLALIFLVLSFLATVAYDFLRAWWRSPGR